MSASALAQTRDTDMGIPADLLAELPQEEVLPRRFGPFELARQVGLGGMAAVYEAWRLGARGVRARAALKVLLPGYAADERFVSLFVREAELLSLLAHPNLVALQELGQAEGRLFMALEYVDGCDLGRLLFQLQRRGERMPPGAVIDLLGQALRGLGAAHRARGADGAPLHLVHRDMKPGNILLGEGGVVKVADLGVALTRASSDAPEPEAQVKGTLTYMSPEQVNLKPLSPVSDLFSMGLILFELVVGEALIPRGSLREVVSALMRFDPGVALARVPEDRAAFLPVLEAALEPRPEWRYGSAREMEDDLNALRALVHDAPPLEVVLAPLLDEVRDGPREGGADPSRFTPEDLRNFHRPPPMLALVG